ncbi:MAG: hypothetical protein ABJI60_11565 [Kangiellaceae bacterium]|jgi:hypothetical protein
MTSVSMVILLSIQLFASERLKNDLFINEHILEVILLELRYDNDAIMSDVDSSFRFTPNSVPFK